MFLNLELEFLLVEDFSVGEGRHVAGKLGVSITLDNGQMSLEGGHESLYEDGIKAFLKGTVLINEFSGFNLIGDMESLQSLADVFNGLDDLGGGGASGEHVDGVELLLEEELAGVGGIDEGASLRFNSNLVLLGLLLLLGKKTVFLNWVGFLHGL